jgi:glycosyltransferase involved in cell wall biosynthesis
MSEVKGLVSVSIPFYNSERFLSETIESVLAQTYTDWELLLVDDGSVDRSTEIALEYAAKSPDKIRYLEHAGHRNRGLTCSRNLGARHSCGEYLAFLDSDDVWLPHKLDAQVAFMDSQPEAGFIYGHSEYWYDWDENRTSKEANQVPSLAPGGKLYLPPLLLKICEPIGSYGAPCPSSFLMRRTAFDHVGGSEESFNPDTYQSFEDKAFLTKMYLSVPTFVDGRCLDRYRCRSDSMWHSIKGTRREELERRFYFRWVRRYLRQQSITDRELWKIIRRAAWAYWFLLPAAATGLIRRIQNRFARGWRQQS